jgi:hypothetical protein
MPTQAQLLFLGGCIPARLALTYIAKVLPLPYLPLLGFFTLCMALGFLYLFFTGKRQVGTETGNKPIWWQSLRWLHGLLYLLFSLLAFAGKREAYIVLLVDTLLGLGIFLGHYFTLQIKK